MWNEARHRFRQVVTLWTTDEETNTQRVDKPPNRRPPLRPREPSQLYGAGKQEESDTTSEHPSHPITIEVWMRGQVPKDVHEHQQAVLERLSHFEDEGVIARFSVHTWEQRINSVLGDSPFETTHPALTKVREFNHWSDQHDVSLPGFQRRTHSSLLTNTSREVFETPILCLGIYDDTNLHEVIPHSGSEGHRTVTAYLDALAPPVMENSRKHNDCSRCDRLRP